MALLASNGKKAKETPNLFSLARERNNLINYFERIRNIQKKGGIMRFLMGFLLLMAGVVPLPTAAQTACPSTAFMVNLATPVSSRINWAGDEIQAVIVHPLTLPDQSTIPAGTLIQGKVQQVSASRGSQSGTIKLTFRLVSRASDLARFAASVATPDGWLRQTDRNTPVWQVNPNHSTRLLNQKIERRLGSNRAVWASVLGINENVIPNPTSDAFMAHYNQHDVLVGAGDTLKLQFVCP